MTSPSNQISFYGLKWTLLLVYFLSWSFNPSNCWHDPIGLGSSGPSHMTSSPSHMTLQLSYWQHPIGAGRRIIDNGLFARWKLEHCSIKNRWNTVLARTDRTLFYQERWNTVLARTDITLFYQEQLEHCSINNRWNTVLSTTDGTPFYKKLHNNNRTAFISLFIKVQTECL